MSIENTLTRNDLLSLVQVAGELTSEIDLKDLLQLILTKSGELTDSPDGAVILYNKKRDSLYFAGAIGNNASMLLKDIGEFAEEVVPVIGSKAGAVFSSGKSVIDNYLVNDSGHYKKIDEQTNQVTESMLCVPLIAGGERLGVMQILNKRSGEYNHHDQVLLEQFANYAAVGLRNAGLFEKLIARSGLHTSQESGESVTELLDLLESPPGNEKLTVLFADMRGFRSLCQLITNPNRMLKITSEFVTMLSEQVLKNGGIVNKYMGDGILALFRREDHARRAVKCAFTMVDEFIKLRSSWQKVSGNPMNFLDIGVGITTDDVIIGTVGSGKVQDFTAIGTTVNLAAAFEKEARGGRRILVDNPTYDAVMDMVAPIDKDDLIEYILKQHDQTIGHPFLQYHIKAPVVKEPVVKSHRVFISHNESDRQFVEKELIPLLDKNSIEPWYSKDDIVGGDRWIQSIFKALNTCNYMLVIVSHSAVDSYWLKQEVESAAILPHLRDKIIPIQLDDTKLEDVDPILSLRQSIDARDKDRFSTKLIALFK